MIEIEIEIEYGISGKIKTSCPYPKLNPYKEHNRNETCQDVKVGSLACYHCGQRKGQKEPNIILCSGDEQ